MPLIHTFYRPDESLQRMLEGVVLRPLRQELPDLWQKLGDGDVLRSVRENVLDHGRTDFNQPYEGPSPLNAGQVFYSPAQKVLLYCAVYMPMHLYSSYHVYRTFLPYPRVMVLFIDVGCGPLTSGIAYRAFAEHADIAYIGIDRADEMINKAEKINERGCSGSSFFKCSALIYDYNSLQDRIGSYASSDETIIFNFCYFLASHSLNARDLTKVLVQLVRRYPKHPMRVVYQNPPDDGFHNNWEILKDRLLACGFTATGLEEETFSYPRLTNGRSLTMQAACETLYKPPA